MRTHTTSPKCGVHERVVCALVCGVAVQLLCLCATQGAILPYYCVGPSSPTLLRSACVLPCTPCYRSTDRYAYEQHSAYRHVAGSQWWCLMAGMVVPTDHHCDACWYLPLSIAVLDGYRGQPSIVHCRNVCSLLVVAYRGPVLFTGDAAMPVGHPD